MIYNVIKGDLVATLKASIDRPKQDRYFMMGQGCNCFIRQGAGIAGQLRAFPEVYQADVDYGKHGDPFKLGDFSVATLNEKSVVFNMYTQFDLNPQEHPVEYGAIVNAFQNVARYLEDFDEILYVPMLGAGLAGGKWDVIHPIIERASGNLKVVVVEFEQGTVIDW